MERTDGAGGLGGRRRDKGTHGEWIIAPFFQFFDWITFGVFDSKWSNHRRLANVKRQIPLDDRSSRSTKNRPDTTTIVPRFQPWWTWSPGQLVVLMRSAWIFTLAFMKSSMNSSTKNIIIARTTDSVRSICMCELWCRRRRCTIQLQIERWPTIARCEDETDGQWLAIRVFSVYGPMISICSTNVWSVFVECCCPIVRLLTLTPYNVNGTGSHCSCT